MDNHQRGDLFLKVAPKGKIEKQVIAYLLSLRQNSSQAAMTDKVKNAPTVLFKDISAQRALTIAADLQQLGGSAAFVPYAVHGPSAAKNRSADYSSPPHSRKVRHPATPNPERWKWSRIIFLLLLLLLSLTLLVLEYFPFLNRVYDRLFLESTAVKVVSPIGISPDEKKMIDLRRDPIKIHP